MSLFLKCRNLYEIIFVAKVYFGLWKLRRLAKNLFDGEKHR